MGNACARPGQQDQVDLEGLRMKRATSADNRMDMNGYERGSVNNTNGIHSYNVMNPARTGSVHNSWSRHSTTAEDMP